MILMIPMWVEINNTKNIAIVIRDFNVYIYNDGKQCCRMKQISDQNINNSINDKSYFYGDEGKYSFLIESHSISRYTLMFALKKSEFPNNFDELRIIYYDYKDRKIVKKLRNISKPWTIAENEIDIEWTRI